MDDAGDRGAKNRCQSGYQSLDLASFDHAVWEAAEPLWLVLSWDATKAGLHQHGWSARGFTDLLSQPSR